MTIKIKSQDAHADGNLAISGNVTVGGVTSATGGLLTVGYGITAKNIGASVPYLQTYNSNASTNLKTWRLGGGNGGDLQVETVNDAYSSSTERMRITSSGEVMIGTTALAGWGKLSVSGSSADTSYYYNATARLTIQQQNTTVNNFSSISFGNAGLSDSAAIWAIHQTHGTSTAVGALVFGTTNSGYSSTERMRITSSGNVGIGTSSPNVKLHLYESTATANFLRLENSVGSTYLGTNADGTSELSASVASGVLKFMAGGGVERMRITSSGNVGIGTSSPAVRLHVADNVSGGLARGILENTASSGFTDLLIKSLGATTYSSLSMAGNYNYIFFIDGAQSTERARITSDSTGNLGFATGASATERMRITSSGNVGIGTSSPSETLHLYYSTGDNFYAVDSGNAISYSGIKFLSQGSQKWKLANSGSTTSHSMYILDADNSHGVYLSQNTQSWAAASDSRLKDVQGTITNALDKVQQLTGVKFKWKRESDNPDAKVRVGLIAQDVQEVLPEAVDDESPELITDEETGRVSGGLGVRYTEVIPLLVNAIKELTARVVTLEQAVA